MNKKILANRYQLIRQIGGGGMAVVYLAQDTLLDRQVAVKLLREEYVDDPDFIRQFQKEAQAIAKLSHHNIVNIYDFGESEQKTYLVMEYVEGETLKDIIREHGPLPVEQVLDYSIQVCQGMIQAHGQHIVHKDIKPHNILIDQRGVVKVTDFGIAQAANNLTITHNKGIMGSAHYFSPEQAKGEIVDYATDIYSLGVVMYEMVTGKVPFTGENPVSVALKHIQATPESIMEYGKSIPQELERIIFKAMEKNPVYRFSSMKQMMEALIDLQAYLSGQSNGEQSREKRVPEVTGKKETTFHDYGDETRIHHDVVVQQPKKVASKVQRKVNVANLIVAALIVCGLFTAGLFGMTKWMNKDEVKVPNIVGETTLDGQKLLVSEGLSINIIDRIYDDEFEEDEIISQEPKAESRVKAGRVIDVVVSLGPDQAVVPDLLGKTEREAEVALENEGLVLGKTTMVESKDYSAGQVAYQSLPAESTAAHGTAVDVMISEGSKVKVPSVAGKPVDEAREILASYNLEAETSATEESTEYAAQTVISQSPVADTEIEQGARIKLVVSSGPPAVVTKSGEIGIVIPQNGQTTVQVTDEQGTSVIYNQYMQAGDYLSQSFEYVGSAEVIVFCNGITVLTKNYN